jgi:hypothetical protein
MNTTDRPVVTIYHVTMPDGRPATMELLPFAQAVHDQLIEEWNARAGRPAGTRSAEMRTETRPCTEAEIRYGAYVAASDAARRPAGDMSPYSFHRLDWAEWNAAGQPSSDDDAADAAAAVWVTVPRRECAGGCSPDCGPRVGDRVTVRSGRIGTVVGWARSAESDARYQATGDEAELAGEDGPLVEWDGQGDNEAPAAWYGGEAMRVLTVLPAG